MLWQALWLLCGVILRLLVQPPLPGWVAGAAAAVGALALCHRNTRLPALVMLGFALAQSAVHSHAAGVQQIEERVLARACITGIAQLSGRATRFDATLSFPRDPQRLAQRARISWSGAAGRGVHAGECWQLLLRLRPPVATLNFQAVDSERNLLRDHVQVLAGVIASPLNKRLTIAPAFSLLALRERLARRISMAVTDPASGALLAALAVGETGEVTRGQWRIFNSTGITHLVAISGMHVTAFALLAMAVVRRLWTWLAVRGAIGWPRERCAALAGVVLATGYSLLAGFSVPTQRTLLMLAVWLVLRESARASRSSASLGFAVVAVLLWDPLAVLAAGFWLSFLAVAAIIGIAGGALRPGGALRVAATVQWAVFVALLPATLAIFGSVSVAGLLVNVAAIPLFTWVLVPVALLSTVVLLCLPDWLSQPLLEWVLWLGAGVANRVAPWLAQAADSPHALWGVAPAWWWFALAVIAVPCVLLPWHRSVRLAGVLVVLPLLWRDVRPAPGELVMTVFDVGQATAVLVRSGARALLWGTGDSFGSDGVAVEQAVLPYLRANGVVHLDALVLPRFDRDSGAGLAALLTVLSIDQVWGSAIEALAPEVQPCAPGTVYLWPPWRLQVMPDATGRCALSMQGPMGSFVLSERVPADRPLVDPAPSAMLWLAHRGQGPGLTPAQVVDAKPTWIVASVSHSALATSAWQQLAVALARDARVLLATAEQGALELHFEKTGRLHWRAARDLPFGVWRGLVADGGNNAWR